MYYVSRVLEECLDVKFRVKLELERILDEESRVRSLKDWHARRAPIPCGMTIHTGLGCSYGCTYCYIYDMGFTTKPIRYPISGEELVYALVNNKHFYPGLQGTLLAFGSITEPFQKNTLNRALEYLKVTWNYLKNPQQVSTKSYLDLEIAKSIRKISDPKINILVTIITISKSKLLEPNAPPPEVRFETISVLSSLRFNVYLFLRPLIPGVISYDEVLRVLSKAVEAGVKGVVVGGFRATDGNIKRMKALGLNLDDIFKRLPRIPKGREQVPIRIGDIKNRVLKAVNEYGLKAYPSSCSVNIESHGLACTACSMGPCGDLSKLPIVDEDVVQVFRDKLGINVIDVKEVNRYNVEFITNRISSEKVSILKHVAVSIFKRKARIRVVK